MHFSGVVRPFTNRLCLYSCLLLCCAAITAARVADAAPGTDLFLPGAFTSLGSNPFTNSGTCTIDTTGSGPVLTLPDSSTITGVVALGSIAVFTFDSISVPSNVTVVGLQNAGSRPVALLSHGDVTIGGIIDVSGAGGQSHAAPGGNTGGAGGAAGPGGGGGGGGGGGFNSGSGGTIVKATAVRPAGLGLSFPGGVGGAGLVNGSNGNPGNPTDEGTGGTGGAGGAVEPNGSGTGGTANDAGGGGAFGGNGGNADFTPGAGGTAYGDLSIILQGGSGGGGGGGIAAGTDDNGAAGGGGGGGAVEIGAVNQIIITGSVLANGGSGGSDLRNGGGGAGGGILLNGDAVTFSGSGVLSAAGGAGPVFSGGGGGGRISILAATAITTEGTDLTTRVNLAGGSASSGGNPGSNGVLVTSGTICPTLRVVLNANDSGPGSLRQAILDAGGCPATNTITFAPSAYGTITLTGGELAVTSDLFIDGPGATNVAVNGNYPNTTNRVFDIAPGLFVTISGLTITNGFDAGGGGIYNDHSMLTVSNCTISGNSAGGNGGGGIYNDGQSGSATLVIVNSTLGGNSSYGGGGGILNEGEAGGATLEIVNSTLNGNSARNGGGLYSDGEDHGNNLVRIFNSTVSSNSANTGGGIFNDGELGSATMEIVNSTLSGNSATNSPGGGGIFNLGQSGNAMLEILNSTLSGNSATNGPGGIYIQGLLGSATLDIASTILDATGASGGTIGSDSGTVTSWGYNLSSDGGGGFLTNTGDQTNTSPLLGPLQDNGGPTFTHALLCGSPAIDAGTNFSGSATDQRGLPRTVEIAGFPNAPGGDGTDVGAFELQQVCYLPPVAICTNVTVSAGTNCTASASIDGGSYDPNTNGTVTLAQSPPGPYELGTNQVTLTVTDNHGLSNSCSGTVIVVDTTPPTIICPSDITSNTAPGECGATITWKGPEAVDNCGTVNVWCSPSSGTLFAQGTTRVTCTATDEAGNTNSCGFNVTVGQSAVCGITASGSADGLTICQGQTVELTAANAMKSYLWTGPEQNGATVRTIVVGTAGTYYCTQAQYYGSTNCCSVTVVVNPPPNAAITGNLVITNGLPTTLVGPGGLASQYWTGPQNNGLASRSNTVIDPGIYTLHVTDTNGCQNTGSVTVLNQTPAPCSITASGDSGDLIICQGGSTILTGANGMSSYLWNGPGVTNVAAKSIRVGTQGTYTVQQIDGNGLTNSCSVFLTVHPMPTVNIFGTRTFCQGTNTTLYGPSGMSQYLWLGPQNNGRNTQSNTVSVAGTYTLTVTDSNGCQNAVSAPVTVINCP